MAYARILYAFSNIFAYCEMGERISGSFGEIENLVNEMDWHLFPIQTQRLMLMLLMGTQRSVKFMGYGNFPANRITMKSVSFY